MFTKSSKYYHASAIFEIDFQRQKISVLIKFVDKTLHYCKSATLNCSFRLPLLDEPGTLTWLTISINITKLTLKPKVHSLKRKLPLVTGIFQFHRIHAVRVKTP